MHLYDVRLSSLSGFPPTSNFYCRHRGPVSGLVLATAQKFSVLSRPLPLIRNESGQAKDFHDGLSTRKAANRSRRCISVYRRAGSRLPIPGVTHESSDEPAACQEVSDSPSADEKHQNRLSRFQPMERGTREGLSPLRGRAGAGVEIGRWLTARLDGLYPSSYARGNAVVGR